MTFGERLLNRAYFIYLKGYYHFYKNRYAGKIDEIMRFSKKSFNLKSGGQEEQALPGFFADSKNGWFKYMFSRYFFSLRHIKNKIVLDSGCGLGWGSYLICGMPRELISIDINEAALEFARKTWFDPKLSFRKLSILEIGHLGKTFDVVLSYEIIEHLKREDGIKYLGEISGNLAPRGKLIMSSYFPSSAEDAEKEEGKNPFHLHIYTKSEMREYLSEFGFAKVRFFGNLMLLAEKKR